MSRGFSPSKSVCSEYSGLSTGLLGERSGNSSNKLDFSEFKLILSILAKLIFP
jgi:hypothetical protein